MHDSQSTETFAIPDIFDYHMLSSMTTRQLDEVVAKVVMNWDVVWDTEDASFFTLGGTWNYGTDYYTVDVPSYYEGENRIEEPCPFTLTMDWSASELIVMEMERRGYCLMVHRYEVWFHNRTLRRGPEMFAPRTTIIELPRTVAIAAVLALKGRK